jgi:hypothetical protein
MPSPGEAFRFAMTIEQFLSQADIERSVGVREDIRARILRARRDARRRGRPIPPAALPERPAYLRGQISAEGYAIPLTAEARLQFYLEGFIRRYRVALQEVVPRGTAARAGMAPGRLATSLRVQRVQGGVLIRSSAPYAIYIVDGVRPGLMRNWLIANNGRTVTFYGRRGRFQGRINAMTMMASGKWISPGIPPKNFFLAALQQPAVRDWISRARADGVDLLPLTHLVSEFQVAATLVGQGQQPPPLARGRQPIVVPAGTRLPTEYLTGSERRMFTGQDRNDLALSAERAEVEAEIARQEQTPLSGPLRQLFDMRERSQRRLNRLREPSDRALGRIESEEEKP